MTTGVRKSFDIAAYTYQAELLCGGCIVKATVKTKTLRDELVTPADIEGWLDWLAKSVRVDRRDEGSFDSDDFPKVVFVDGLQHGEKCGSCGEEL